MNLWQSPPTLRGRHVVLEPLAREHAEGLRDAARDGELWKLWYTTVPSPEQTESYIETALALQGQGRALPFVVRDHHGDIVGSTRFGNVESLHQRVEIGWTWYAQRAQRTGLNTEAKRLLLGYAFETLECIAVEFRTHWHNQQSRAAIARLGAKQDGVLRSHMIMPDGGIRDTVVFSIIASEWPAVKQGLEFKLARSDSA
jgi:RimJ/RimL family protein N-acetyltransferase